MHALATASTQAKLKVDQPDDPYEQEADQIAGLAMSGRGGSPPATDTASCCSGCASGGSCADEVKRMPAGGPAGAGVGDLGSDLEARISSSGGGQQLPGPTRIFFEERFGRDFGDVRVHSGPDAAQLSDEMHAHAFTHGSHIWLGSGIGLEPSHTLAHEIAHVVQQSDPDKGSSPTPDVVQRFAPYWEPASWSGPQEHSEILPKMSKQGGVFVEAPIPNASKPTRYTSDTKADYGKKGRADLYDASTTVGVYFLAPQVPRALPPTGLQLGGARKGLPDSAPIPGPLQSVRRVNQAPSSVTVGDLKPDHGTLEAQEGTAQVLAYLDGFRLASDEVNEKSAANHVSPAGATWSPRRQLFTRSAFESLTPPDYKHPATAQAPRPVVLKQNGRRARPLRESMARLVVSPDPVNDGIVNYTWVEDAPVSIRQTPRMTAIGAAVSEKIVKPLKQPPEKEKVGRKAKRAISRLGRPAGRVQRNLKDPFDLGAWRENRQKIKDDVRAIRGSADVRDAQAAALLVEEREATIQNTRLPLAPLPAETRETGATYDRIGFWTSTPAGFFGVLRRIFGRTFVRVADAYERMRKKFTEWFRGKTPTGGGGGLPGAALRVLFKLLKMAAKTIVHRTLDVLRDSLVEGVSKKLMALIPEESAAALRAKVEEAQQLHAELEEKARLTAESVVDTVFPGYQQYADRIQKVVEIVGDITRIINLVRWGARAVACVAPPAIGCLWALAQAALEYAAGKVINTCWFQKKVAPFVAGLHFISEELPRGLAKKIIEGIRALLPAWLADVFADVSAAPPTNIDCDDEEPAGRAPTDDEIAVAELQEGLGDERFNALLALLRQQGVPDGVPLNRARCEELGRLIEQNAVSTQDLQRLAEGKGGVPVPLAVAIGQLKGVSERSPVEARRPEPTVTVEIEEAFESPDYQTTIVGTRPGGETGHADVRSANAEAAAGSSGDHVKGWRVMVVRVRGRLARGEKVNLDIRMTSTGGGRQRTRYLNRLETTVTEVAASEKHRGVMEAYLEVTHDQKFFFGRDEIYTYREQTEFTHEFKAATK